MPSRAQLAATASRAFAAAGDIVRAAVLTRSTPGAYDPESSMPAAATLLTATGRALFDQRSFLVSRRQQGLEVQPGDESLILEGFAALPPEKGDQLTIDGRAMTILDVDNLLQAGAIWFVVAR